MDTKAIVDNLIAEFDAAHQRHLDHCAAVDAMPLPNSPRVTISAAGTHNVRFWLKSVSWKDGAGWQLNKTTWTRKREQSISVLPDAAIAIAKAMSNLVDLRFEKP